MYQWMWGATDGEKLEHDILDNTFSFCGKKDFLYTTNSVLL
jgi:hypothetical protein